MTDPRTGCLERQLQPDDYDELPTCCLCDEIDELTEADGKLYCAKHLAETFGTEERRRDFIRAHADEWCKFFAESIENEHLTDVPARFLDALRELVGNDYFEREFCETWAADEYREFLKGEVA